MDNNNVNFDDFLKDKEHFLLRFKKYTKRKIFKIINVTLKQDSLSLFGVSVICFLELMQLLSYSFHSLVYEYIYYSLKVLG